MTLLDDHPLAQPTSTDVEVLFKEARGRRRRRWVRGSCLAVTGILAALLGLDLSGMGSLQSTHPSGGNSQKAPVRQSSDGSRVNVDVLTAQAQTTVRVAGTKVVRGSAAPAAPGVGPPIALPREGYIIGITGGHYQSISDDLQTIVHTWSSVGGRSGARE